MVSTSTALRGGLTITDSKSITKIVGIAGDNGLNNIISNQHTMIGNMPTLVAPDLAADLLSANPLVDRNCSIHLDSSGGCICNDHTNKCIKVHRDDRRWKVWLRDVVSLLSDTDDSPTANAVAANRDLTTAYTGKTIRLTESVRETVINLHNIMGHPSVKVMCHAISGNSPTWKLPKHSQISPAQVRKVFKTYTCLHCVLAKRNLDGPGEQSEDTSLLTPGELISADPVGKISPPTRHGHQWLFLFKDMATGRVHTFTASSKDFFEAAFVQVVDYYKARGFKCKVLRTDSEVVLNSASMKQSMVDLGITHQFSTPYRHYQNSVEREVQTYLKGVSLLLHSQQWLQANQWDLAVHHFADVRNHTPNVHHAFKSPDHRVNGKATNLSKQFQFAFGDLVAVGIPKELRDWKFDLRNDIGIYVGQPEGTVDAANVYFPDTGQVLTRGSVRKIEVSDEQVLRYFQRRKDMRETSLTPKSFRRVVDDMAIVDFRDTSDIESDLRKAKVPRLSSPLSDADMNDHHGHGTSTTKRMPSAQPKPFDMTLRSHSKATANTANTYELSHLRDLAIMEHQLNGFLPVAPGIARDDIISHLSEAVYAYAAKVTTKRALGSADREQWLAAIRAEIEQLFRHTLVEEALPSGIRKKDYILIHSTMQLKIKLKADMTIDKYKARLCARGDMLSGLIEETYSPTIGSLARATAHQLAILDNMHTCVVDTVGAYLYQDYPTTATPLYLKLEPHVAEALGLKPEATYRVRKYLYGLPDSGRAYYHAYSEHLTSHGYKRTLSDPCLFTKLANGHRTYIWIHVDDTFVASTDPNELLEFQRVIGLKYQYTLQNDVTSYLGITITKLPNGAEQLTQPKLLSELFAEFHPELIRNTSRVDTPHSGSTEQSPDWDSTPIDRRQYLHLLGALIYLTLSRPDIATAVSFGATHSVNPTEGAYRELIRCVQYLYNTQEVGLQLHRGNTDGPLTLRCYVDASYLTHADSKSHTGYCLSFGTIGTFYSKSVKQNVVTTSSTHAEMRALYQLVLDIIYVVHLCGELGRPITLPAIVMEDNQPVIDLTKDISSRTKKCKHFLMLVNFVREQVHNGLIELRKVPTDENVADILTKILKGHMFTKKAEQLLGLEHFMLTT